ncbi:hypothetical protein [Dactylosporangium sp. CA-139066]|uniref:hypothetical protein n=1 Tax=Dactylosporangium sp. CA-139066 TaxID=3239930 RepID=UPI003D91835B
MTTVVLGGPMCRRCVRRISRLVGDVPGVVALELCAGCGRLRVRGPVRPADLAAALGLDELM